MKKSRVKIALIFLTVYLLWGFLCLIYGSDQDSKFQRVAGIANLVAAKNIQHSVEAYYSEFDQFPPTLEAAIEYFHSPVSRIYFSQNGVLSDSFSPIPIENRWHFIWRPKSFKDFIISLFVPFRFDARLILPSNKLSFEYKLSELDLKTAPPDLVVFETPQECGKAAGCTVIIGDFFSGGRMKINKKQPQP